MHHALPSEVMSDSPSVAALTFLGTAGLSAAKQVIDLLKPAADVVLQEKRFERAAEHVAKRIYGKEEVPRRARRKPARFKVPRQYLRQQFSRRRGYRRRFRRWKPRYHRSFRRRYRSRYLRSYRKNYRSRRFRFRNYR